MNYSKLNSQVKHASLSIVYFLICKKKKSLLIFPMHIIGSWMNVGVDEIAQFLITDNLLLVLRSLRQAVLVILGLPKSSS